ncbi:MAG: hypothetical protein ACTMUB_04045 [cyanobacterium endosymbiont of Rhopalodia musculus]|uniref:hypothetical protein n=1 Tax=cyanobacterium endosymbiont of Epithemia clementina EcSB TaxID=3034674 RepID=UPI00247FBD62|nr:hypothetical protein [cyanobacterium endosymbiont of Epithemia clementina EcSB]WGT67359.1 hypothetical protein P3F56_09185 [cyanobacterium endosymbiont of Epithemia clementina EcSB]
MKEDLSQINLVLGILNLILGLTLNGGGQILKAIVWKITNDRLEGGVWLLQAVNLLVHSTALQGSFLFWQLTHQVQYGSL